MDKIKIEVSATRYSEDEVDVHTIISVAGHGDFMFSETKKEEDLRYADGYRLAHALGQEVREKNAGVICYDNKYVKCGNCPCWTGEYCEA